MREMSSRVSIGSLVYTCLFFLFVCFYLEESNTLTSLGFPVLSQMERLIGRISIWFLCSLSDCSLIMLIT